MEAQWRSFILRCEFTRLSTANSGRLCRFKKLYYRNIFAQYFENIYQEKNKAKIRDFLFHSVLRKQAVHFLHIGKTGGSATAKALPEHISTPKYYFVDLHSKMTCQLH
ncbi:MAG: hypothetical protein DRR42_17735 [Gammaproteobacteria bacterium]|nr:MAG: hypothetical protein DRR42_17735 [Gammaproteobacteria bacterium]